ncbi:type I-D CRISPR-associated helicase Cas3' [Thermodesulfovibrionales bacterium]|nr:type I-D CRISPR-associated helicase Cas3' [Thermodesulfovibrionales bacterium]MCL0083263.1 type I-D CRISPR-associated helicase Cas3' [Thermodesulfovibrionales bacterium]
MSLLVAQRTVKEIDGVRPFQKATLDALDSKAQIIIVDAPVGAGKSHIVRQAIDRWQGAVVLTYPTKILMDAQRSAIKSDFPDSIIWPYETGIPKNNAPTIFYYSSDALVAFIKQQNMDYCLDRSELIDTILHQHFFASRKNILLSSPDVLHLLVNLKAYRGSQRLLSFLTGAIVVFDEFHLYIGLKHFPKLLDNLFESGIKKAILLSATPVSSEELLIIFEKYETLHVDFSESVGDAKDKTFNYSLNLEFVNRRYTKKDELFAMLNYYIPKLPKPLAVIVDSVFRLRHLMPMLKRKFSEKWKIIEYSGFLKDNPSLDEKTILVGTSSIEVGVNMVFKSLITEASYWTSAIQRIGRVGRFCNGNVVVLTTKNMEPFMSSKSNISRDELENEILKSALKDIKMTHVSGDMFRGDSYPFLVYDLDSGILSNYTDSIFAMYEPQRWIDDWQSFSLQEKKRQLEKYITSEEVITDILLRDKLFPFWGIIEGRLRDKYEKISVHAKDDELTIFCEGSNMRFDFERGM